MFELIRTSGHMMPNKVQWGQLWLRRYSGLSRNRKVVGSDSGLRRQRILGQVTKPQIAPDEQFSTLHGSLHV